MQGTILVNQLQKLLVEVRHHYGLRISLSELEKKFRPISKKDLKQITKCLRVSDVENNLNSENIRKWAVGKEDFVIGLTEEVRT